MVGASSTFDFQFIVRNKIMYHFFLKELRYIFQKKTDGWMEYITKLHQDEIKDREKHMIVYIFVSRQSGRR